MTLAALLQAAPDRPFVAAALLAAGLVLATAVGAGVRSARTRPPFPRDAAPLALAALVGALAWHEAAHAAGGADAPAWARDALRLAAWAPPVLLALARGPLLAAVPAVAFARLAPPDGLADVAALHGVLAVTAAGWWALRPPPAAHRAVAPVALLVGAGVATASIGWAARVASDGHPPRVGDLAALAGRPGIALAIGLAALLLAALPPTWWRAAAGAAATDLGSTGAAAGDAGGLVRTGAPWGRGAAARLTGPAARRKRRARRLTPPPDPGPLRRG